MNEDFACSLDQDLCDAWDRAGGDRADSEPVLFRPHRQFSS